MTSARRNPMRADEAGTLAQSARQVAAIQSAAAGAWRRCFPTSCALVLTGSMARGEATFLHSRDSVRVAGDAEFLAIFDGKRIPARDVFANARTSIEQQLAESGIACHVDLRWFRTKWLRSMRPDIFACELQTCGQVVAGDPDILGIMPAIPPAAIPPEDGWRVLANRMIELLGVMADTEGIRPDGRLPARVLYATVKLYLDMATSLLVFLGRFVPGYHARLRELRQARASCNCDVWPFAPGDFAKRVEIATEFKLCPAPGPQFDWDFCFQAIDFARHLWRWELARMTGSSSSDAELWDTWVNSQPAKERLYGWLVALRRLGWRESVLQFPRWLQLVLHISPRYCIYGAGAQFLFRTPEVVGGPAPVPRKAARVSTTLPIGCVNVAHWRSVAHAIADDYNKFLLGTRA